MPGRLPGDQSVHRFGAAARLPVEGRHDLRDSAGETASDELIPREGNVPLYTTPNGKVRIEVFFPDEAFWLSQRRTAELFGVEVPTVNYHCKEIIGSKELREEGLFEYFEQFKSDGRKRPPSQSTPSLVATSILLVP